MRYTHVGLVLTVVGWLSSGGMSALAQDTTPALLDPPSGATATATNPGEPPTPQFLRVTIGLEAGGLTLRMRYDPAWVASDRLHVHVGQAPTQRAPAVDVAPSPQGGADALQQVLKQTLERRAQPSAVLSP
jgi:hypothetical protein